ncbi:MAG: hypothetical protein LC789_13190 [Actinobacteria bacterium]|nr:hypothetical protein [Actinomycetota bacterium]
MAEAVETDHAPALQPVVAGAAAEAPQSPPPGVADSPASRARTAEGRDVLPPERARAEAPPPARRHRRRLGVVAALAALLVLAGAGASWAYVRSQYYVGAQDERVAVFRGVSGSVVGVALSSVEETTDLTTTMLGELDAARVEKGIVAKDKADARRIVERLQTQIPVCPAPAPPTDALPQSPLPSPPAGVASIVPAPTPVATALASPIPCRTP